MIVVDSVLVQHFDICCMLRVCKVDDITTIKFHLQTSSICHQPTYPNLP